MTTRHTISHADELFAGNAYGEVLASLQGAGRGIRFHHKYYHQFGAPLTADNDSMIDAATGAEAPNTETVTYTPDTDGASPTDGAQDVEAIGGVNYWVLDVPRNIQTVVTHGSSVVAMTIVVTGLDLYKQPMSETITVAATGASQTDLGLKAFKWVRSIALVAAADAEANTVNVGFGDVLGLPFKITNKDDIVSANADGSVEDATIAVGVTTDPATATTGDVRGTVDFTQASNATIRFGVDFLIDHSGGEATFGVTNFAG